MMGVLLIVVPGLAIASWLALLFIRKRHYEKGVIVFLSTVLAPIPSWYLGSWLSNGITDSLYSSYAPRGTMHQSLPPAVDALVSLLEFAPAAAMIGVFVWLCIYWARRGQQLEEKAPATQKVSLPNPPASVEAAADGGVRARLGAIEQLRLDGLISEEEYAAKRAEIIAKL